MRILVRSVLLEVPEILVNKEILSVELRNLFSEVLSGLIEIQKTRSLL